jgi:hypothetical protein
MPVQSDLSVFSDIERRIEKAEIGNLSNQNFDNCPGKYLLSIHETCFGLY